MSRKAIIPPAQLAEERRKRAAGKARTGRRERTEPLWGACVNAASQLWLEERGIASEAFMWGFR